MDTAKEAKERRSRSWKREWEKRDKRHRSSYSRSNSQVDDRQGNIADGDSNTIAFGECRRDALNMKDNMGDDIEMERLVEVRNPRTEEEEALQQEQERGMLLAYINDADSRLRVKARTRSLNLKAANSRPDEAYFSRLDSSLKKNTALVKKLKTFSASQKDSLLRDMSQLNLTKYISEVASALVEAKLKMSDVGAAVQLCSWLHQKYAEFSPHLLENWRKTLSWKREEQVSNPSKIRVDLRFYSELVSAGIFNHKEGLPLLGSVLTVLVNLDKEEHNNISIILSFCRHCGEDYAGLVPRAVRILSDKYGFTVPRSTLLHEDRQRGVRQLVKDYYNSLCKHLVKQYRELQAFEYQNKKILKTKEELSPERKEKLDVLHSTHRRLLAGAENFAEILDEDVPELPKMREEKVDDIDIMGMLVQDGSDGGGTSYLWVDEETRDFYEVIPDLNELFPANVGCDRTSVLTPQTSEESFEDDLKLEDFTEDDSQEDLSRKKDEEPDDVGETEVNVNAKTKAMFDSFASYLPTCINKDMIDNAAVEFMLNYNNKIYRRKLVKLLFTVPRIRLDLLPFYARMVAILNPMMPDVGADLGDMLKQDFRYHVKKKDQINIESKIKVVRFLGELVKFGVHRKGYAVNCLRILLYDFTHHHIEMACALLESCGRFLYAGAESHQRMKVCLDDMMRKKSVMALDSRYVTMIENAYYYVKPPETAQCQAKKERVPTHEYVRKLLFQDLKKVNTDKILRQMRKLNWEDPCTCAYAVKCLTAAWHVRYYNIRCLASLLAGLVDYQETIGSQVVDGVLEDIRVGMEVNQTKYNQRRVSMVRYLGELYNYRVVDSEDIFKVLYSFITFGTSIDRNVTSSLDPPDHLFRIRLACVLLDTCGQYFTSTTSRKRLDYYIVYFQRYFWFKYTDPVWSVENPFPVGIRFIYNDTITSLRPKTVLATSLEEAQSAVSELQLSLIAKFAEVIPALKDMQQEVESSESVETVEGQLDVIDEERESEEEESEIDEDDDEEGPRFLTCPEDDDFLDDFEKMVAENVQEHLKDTAKPQQIDISIPLHIKRGNRKTYHQRHQGDGTVNFVLMLKKGHKQQYKNLSMPADSELALNLRSKEEEERAEKEYVKRLTLDISERLEEEDYQENIIQTPPKQPPVVNQNHERRQRYQHPKGTPDADAIFGPKKMKRSIFSVFKGYQIT